MHDGCCLPCKVAWKLQCLAALPRDAVGSQLPLGMHNLRSFFCQNSGKSWQLGTALLFNKPPFCVYLGSQGCEAECWAQIQIQPARALASPVRVSPSFSQPVWVITTFPDCWGCSQDACHFLCTDNCIWALSRAQQMLSLEQLSFGCSDAPRK